MASFDGRKSWKPLGIALGVLACVALATVALVMVWGGEVSGETPEQRLESVRRLAAQRPPGSSGALAKAARSDSSPQVRREAIAALTYSLRPDDRAILEEGTRDQNAGVRAIAADTLGLFGDGVAADVLIPLIQSDPDEQVRIAAIRGLVRCKDPRATVVLLETADKGPGLEVKREAMKGFLRRYEVRLDESRRDPANDATWRDLIQRLKMNKRVRDDYAAAGVPIVDRPQDVLSKDAHPERRTGGARRSPDDGHRD